MSDPTDAFQKVIYETLSAALSCEVYDDVPQNADYPYVVIDSHHIMSDDPLASRRDVRFMYLSVWSRASGQKEVIEILSAIDSALHHQKFPMDSGRMVRCYVQDKRTLREPDGETYQGAVTLRVLTEH